MVLGYRNFFEFNDEQRAAYRASLRGKTTQQLHQLEHEKTVARISSGFTMIGGAVASTFTSGLALTWSGVGWRKGHVAHRKLEMVREELLRRREPLYEAGVKDFALAGTGVVVGNVIGAGIVDLGVVQFGSGSSAAAGAIAGGDIASNAANHAAQQASEALHGEASVQAGFEHGEKLVPDMQDNLESIVKDPAGLGLSYLATDAGQHDLGNLATASVGSTGAFVAAQATGEIYSELLLKGYSHTFEANKGAKSTCARATSPRKVECNACSRDIVDGIFMREQSPPLASWSIEC
ncbi:hypothetical protein MBLNU13_g11228t1 [Cladosporium sp. NU13]